MQEKPDRSSHSFYEQETEKIPIIGDTAPDAAIHKKLLRISPDTCGAVNYLLTKTPCKLYIRNVPGMPDIGRIVRVRPDFDNPGYVIAYCSTTFHGDYEVSIGNGVRLDFYFL